MTTVIIRKEDDLIEVIVTSITGNERVVHKFVDDIYNTASSKEIHATVSSFAHGVAAGIAAANDLEERPEVKRETVERTEEEEYKRNRREALA